MRIASDVVFEELFPSSTFVLLGTGTGVFCIPTLYAVRLASTI